MSTSDIDKFLEEAAKRPPGNEVEITIRDLISHWGALRRGYWYVKQIEEDLRQHGLESRPPFTEGWIDNTVRLVRTPTNREDGDTETASTDLSGPASPSQETESTLMGGALTFADLDRILFGPSRPPVVAISRNDTLTKAESLMMANDFSQLPVLSGPRNCEGAISWQSIARTLAHKSDASIVDCIVPVDQLNLSDDVLSNIPRITKNDFIVTKGKDKRIVGLVTTADLADAFETLSGPFLLIGIVENKLRLIAESKFPEAEILSVSRTSSAGRPIESLTLGELKQLFDADDNWQRLNWTIDATVFRQLLDQVLQFRNRVMHFRGSDQPAQATAPVRNLIQWLDYLME